MTYDQHWPVSRLARGDIIALSVNGELRACLVIASQTFNESVYIDYQVMFRETAGRKQFGINVELTRFIPYE